MTTLAGIDIGGTKCAVVLANVTHDSVLFLSKDQFKTPPTYQETVDRLQQALREQIARGIQTNIAGIGISCGGPLDSQTGRVENPPNLPGWDNVDIISPFKREFKVPVALQNDANACALAEWKWGAGRGTRNMVYLTFGTGMGAGLILNGRLYAGTNGLAGEIGHIRMERDGPEGYGKKGSFEGFCSGSGIGQLVRTRTLQWLKEGEQMSYCKNLKELPHVTAQTVAFAARKGDPRALEIYEEIGRQLGRGLAVLVDMLNPDCIVIGGIYMRQRILLEPWVHKELREEGISKSVEACKIIESELGEQVGDYASLSVALQAIGFPD